MAEIGNVSESACVGNMREEHRESEIGSEERYGERERQAKKHRQFHHNKKETMIQNNNKNNSHLVEGIRFFDQSSLV